MADPAVIAAIIAFAATLFGALVAFASSFGVAWYDKRTEKNNANKAILAEIQRLIGVVKRHRKWKELRNPKLPLIPFSTPVYDQNVKNIGWVHADKVVQVVEFYGYVGYLNALQALRKDYIAAHLEDEFNHQYEESLHRLIENFEGKFPAA